jgi:uncharacterized membrane protein
MWIILALLSAIFAASRRVSEKRLTAHLNHYTIAFASQLFSLPITIAAVLLFGEFLNPFTLGLNFWIPLLIVGIAFYPISAFLGLQAIKHDELSNIMPIQSLGPVFVLLPAWLGLGEVPSPVAVAGIVLTVLGVYALGLKGRRLHHPWEPFVRSRSSLYMLLLVAIVAGVSVLDKIAVQASDATFYSLATTLMATTMLYISMRVSHVNELQKIRVNWHSFFMIGNVQGASYTTFLLAISAGPVAYVNTIRSSNVLIASLLGIFVLREKLTKPKLISLILIIIGGTLLALGS